MVSIGELAQRAGVSRRMLRHWDEIGLLLPASVDERTGHRRYAPEQVGRVRAIVMLRSVGFGLDEIAALAGSGLNEERLRELLVQREQLLTGEIDAATRRRVEVRRRLDALDRGRDVIADTLDLGPLPAFSLVGDADLVLTYYGPPGDTPIEVTAGVEADEPIDGLDRFEVAAEQHGAGVRFDEPPDDVGDAWLLLDAALQVRGLATSGVYRQLVARAGGTTLQAPVRPADAC